MILAYVIDDWNVGHLFMEPFFWASFFSWIGAQMVKLVRSALRTHTVDFEYLVSTGGMPSAHSAMVTGLFVSIGLVRGFGTAEAMLALGFASVTMFDAATVRHAAGEQAKLLNRIAQELRKERKLPSKGDLRELLGHTRWEVYGGMITGTVVAIATCLLWPR